jgi:hypothetical protein
VFFIGVRNNNNNLRRITADQEQDIATLFIPSLKEDWVPVVTDPNMQKKEKKEKKDRRTLENEGNMDMHRSSQEDHEHKKLGKPAQAKGYITPGGTVVVCLPICVLRLAANVPSSIQPLPRHPRGRRGPNEVITSRIYRRGEDLQHTNLVDSADSLDKLGWLCSACISML